MGWKSCFAVVGLSLVACDASDSASMDFTVVDSAGITIVTSPAVDLPISYAVDPLFSLGASDEGPESFSRLRANLIGSDRDGRIYILDDLAQRVVVFDSMGTFSHSFGQGGEGPGEFTRPAAIAVSGGGESAVFDWAQKLVFSLSNGDLDREQAGFFVPPPTGAKHLGYFGDRLAALVTASGGELLKFVDDDSELGRANVPVTEMISYPACPQIRLRLPPIFFPSIVWASAEAQLVFNSWSDYRIDLLTPSDTVSIRREMGTRVATVDSVVTHLEGRPFSVGSAGARCTIPPREMAERRGFAESIPWIARIGIDSGHRIWVERTPSVLDQPGLIDVFEPSGQYRGTLPAGTEFPLVFLPNDRVGFIRLDAFDVPQLDVGRVSWN